jgi:hypothetical protein
MENVKRKFSIQTNIKTLKKVWNLFDELGISNLILGKQVEFNPESILDQVMKGDKINELMQTITGNETFDFEELELSEVIDIVANFFTDIAKPFSELQKRGILVETKKVQTTE